MTRAAFPKLREWRQRSRDSLSTMWQRGIDILEYQDPALIRQVSALGAARGGRRRSVSFVLVAAALNALFALAVGVLSGTAFESLVHSFFGFLLTFSLTTGLAFVVGRLLGGKAAFRPFVYVTAISAVPLQVLEALLSVISSLIPVLGFYVLVAVSVLMVLARLYILNLVTQATMQFAHPWQRWVMFAVLLALLVVSGGSLILG